MMDTRLMYEFMVDLAHQRKRKQRAERDALAASADSIETSICTHCSYRPEHIIEWSSSRIQSVEDPLQHVDPTPIVVESTSPSSFKVLLTRHKRARVALATEKVSA